MPVESSDSRQEPPPASRHGGRRPGRIYRRCSSDCCPSRWPLRAGCSSVEFHCGTKHGRRGRAAYSACIRQLRGDGVSRVKTERRYRSGRDCYAQPLTPSRRQAISRSRHSCDLRQATNHDTGRRLRSGRGRETDRSRVRLDAQLHRTPHGSAGARNGIGERTRSSASDPGGVCPGLVVDCTREDRTQAGGVAHRSRTKRARRIARGYRNPRF